MRLQDFRLSVRITAAALFCVAMAGVSLLLLENYRLGEIFINEQRNDLEKAIHGEDLRINKAIESLRLDTLFLSYTPPVSAIMRAALNRDIDPLDGDTRKQWESRLMGIFSAFSKANSVYNRISYIGLNENGREWVGIVNHLGDVEVRHNDKLQPGEKDHYLKSVSGLHEGQVGLSEFGFSQDQYQNHDYMLQAVTPIFSPQGKIFGVVVIRMNVQNLLESASTDLPPGVITRIADRHGNYLFISDPLQPRAQNISSNISQDYPSLKAMLALQGADYQSLQPSIYKTEKHFLAARRIRFDPAQPEQFMMLVYSLPDAIEKQQIAALPLSEIIAGFVFMLLTGGLISYMVRQTFSPLEQITAAANKILAGDRNLRLPELTGGEIGSLSTALNSVLDELNKRENEFHKALAESLPGIFYIIDNAGHVLLWNSMLERVLQYSAFEIARSSALDFFSGEDVDRIKSSMARVFEFGEAEIDAELVAKDGSHKLYHLSERRIFRDGQPILLGVGQDVTEQRQLLKETQLLLLRNQTLIQNSMDGIHIMDAQGQVIEVNDAFCTMLGYSREEVLRLSIADFDAKWTHEQLRGLFKSLITSHNQFETLHRRKDGTLMDVEVATSGAELNGETYLFASSRDITERKRIEASTLRYKRVIETSLDGFWLTDDQGNLLDTNQAYANMSGFSVEELKKMHINQLEAIERPEEVAARIEKIIKLGQDRFETRHRHKDGHLVDIEISTTFMQESQHFFVFCRNITERKQAEEALRVAAVAFETHEAIVITDLRANIISVNNAFSEITGYNREEVLGKNPSILNSGKQDKAFYIDMWYQLLNYGSWAGEIWDKRKNGEVYPKWMTITAAKNKCQETTHYVAIFNDITARKKAEEEIRSLAFYDALTKIPNRRLFLDRLRSALNVSIRRNDYGAVLFIDLDRFKTLNDTLGHDYGDLLLIEVAARTKACVREMDTVARLGGDEFVVLIEGISEDYSDTVKKVGGVAEKIRDALAKTYTLKEREHNSSPSIGICVYHGRDSSEDEVLQRADMAMYQAKNAGRNSVRFFEPVN